MGSDFFIIRYRTLKQANTWAGKYTEGQWYFLSLLQDIGLFDFGYFKRNTNFVNKPTWVKLSVCYFKHILYLFKIIFQLCLS